MAENIGLVGFAREFWPTFGFKEIFKDNSSYFEFSDTHMMSGLNTFSFIFLSVIGKHIFGVESLRISVSIIRSLRSSIITKLGGLQC